MLIDKLKNWLRYPFNKRRIEQAAKCVYAGPEYFERRRGPMDKVYAGPDRDRDEEVNDVYAGPEYFGGDPEEPEEQEDAAPLPEPENAAPPPEQENAAPEQALPKPPPESPLMVYAGPDYFALRARGTGTVYAGPEIMAGVYVPIGAPGPKPPQPVYAGPEPEPPKPVYAGPEPEPSPDETESL